MKEIIFSNRVGQSVYGYMTERCHAAVVEELPKDTYYIGRVDGYEVYGLRVSGFSTCWDYVAVKEEK